MADKVNNNEKLVEKRCSNCNFLLAKVSLQNGKVEIKCKCGTVNTFETKEPEVQTFGSSFDVTVQHISNK